MQLLLTLPDFIDYGQTMMCQYPITQNHSISRPVFLTQLRQGGFSLIELTIVLVIIGLIIGAATIGKDVYRNAIYQRIASDYVQGWAIAYDRYYDGTGHPPGDNPAAPTGRVNAGVTELCGLALRGYMQAAGIEMPSGRAEGSEDRYVYQDSNGIPHELQICFQNVSWSEPGAVPGTYFVRPRNVMVLKSMTSALANLLDNSFDSPVDARFGKLREQSLAGSTSSTSQAWSVDERMAIGSTTST
ncbi:MAG: prepilin-type N-terminal cleavage/methylation domain-containing protein, partial [Sulfuricella denitrificans]|nr:prepilin-type N-terminal cleavage/methylation domain-containing protein [Sulfuricella denitrificans]